ncbi:hypothetical protein K490DRAFT_58764 [Saccharata proteae CBS 121410]|uniref:Secreted protein n=1 Tax=Saccharata proteae CBS 121410 TaxID=1314787 RepID=A0A9P4HSU3_9PEZI|nr:hypothetical protein K490DRAFT_58764 [Saccharata proteae CBS 121410]
MPALPHMAASPWLCCAVWVVVGGGRRAFVPLVPLVPSRLSCLSCLRASPLPTICSSMWLAVVDQPAPLQGLDRPGKSSRCGGHGVFFWGMCFPRQRSVLAVSGAIAGGRPWVRRLCVPTRPSPGRGVDGFFGLSQVGELGVPDASSART